MIEKRMLRELDMFSMQSRAKPFSGNLDFHCGFLILNTQLAPISILYPYLECGKNVPTFNHRTIMNIKHDIVYFLDMTKAIAAYLS
jgi:hypothetical protein